MACYVWVPLLLLAIIVIGMAFYFGNKASTENFFGGHGIMVSWSAPSQITANTQYQWFACNQTADSTCGPSACTTTGNDACPITPNTTAGLNDQIYPSGNLDFGQSIAFSVRSIDTVTLLTSDWVTTVINATSPNSGQLTITSSPTATSPTINNPPAPGDTILTNTAVVTANLGSLPTTVPSATIQVTRGTSVWAYNAAGIRIVTTTGKPTTYVITADTTSTLSVWNNGPATGVPGPLQAGDVITFSMLSIENANAQTSAGSLGFYGQTSATVATPIPQAPGAPTGVTYTFV